MAAQKIGVDPGQILFFDDNYHSVTTAKQAGVQTCGVYDEFSAEYADSVKQAADYFIENFSEILAFV